MIQYCTNLLYFIFHFHHEDGQAGKILSMWERVCLPTQNGYRLWTCYSTCPPHTSWRTWRRQASRISLKTFNGIFWRCFQPSCAGHREKSSPSCSFSGWKCDLKQCKICKICIITSNRKFLYYSIHLMWEYNTQFFQNEVKIWINVWMFNFL